METAQCVLEEHGTVRQCQPTSATSTSQIDVIQRLRAATATVSLASAPIHTPDRQHGIPCRTAFVLNQTLQSFGNILKLTFSVQHLMFVNLLFIDFTQH